jgi:hypothetical protein
MDLRSEPVYDEERQKIILPASSPTELRPGSKSKVHLMAERDAVGENIHHPDDLVCKGQDKPGVSHGR